MSMWLPELQTQAATSPEAQLYLSMAPPTVPGSYGRVLRLSPEGLATLTPDMTPRLTNLWKLSEIAEVAPAPLAA